MNEPQHPSLNLSPKQRFHLDPATVRLHQAMVHTDQFHDSADVAMLEYNHQLCRGDGVAQNYWMMRGAVEYLDTLKRLGEVATIPKRKDHDNLK